MEAAREVFTAAGFEAARIEDIAARAGKTRGAFYDNFRDKEDIFFAIFEEDIARDQQKVRERLSGASDLDERVEVLATHLEELLHDRRRLLLNLEFKMYVIRHPAKRKRLSELYYEMGMRCSMTKINTLFPELADASDEKRRRLAMEIGAVMDGLALNSLFSPEAISGDLRRRYLRLSAQEALRATRDV